MLKTSRAPALLALAISTLIPAFSAAPAAETGRAFVALWRADADGTTSLVEGG